ncbi:Aste57867_2403 [Aphanomyces stellatus]|uniref:Aste57867_2403 protein n=1 Tax=Aphanomyces stellatus TaxID=120398 RepID=A0A485K7G5_9STRA|nr:hypothetical protein As57867_002397 [Aphanomyces stellatus]VFT79604.1 Aste57867_2403 [Aphanomyces stellatus]
MVRLRLPSINYQTYLTASHRTTDKGDHSRKKDTPNVFRSSFRIGSNLVAAGLVVLSLVTVIVLISAGMFNRHVVLDDIGIDCSEFQNYGRQCRLDAAGFAPNTCSAMEIATTTAAAWTALGKRLALQWHATSAAPYYVTTCIKGSPTAGNTGWSALVFLAGYDAFPKCQPSGAQEIAGLAQTETTVRDDYPNGIYMLAVFADKTMGESTVHVNSDGTTDLVFTNFTRSLVTVDGVISADNDGINTVEYSYPLGPRYMIKAFAYTVMLDITPRVDNSTPWTNVGRYSKKAIMVSWDTGHTVSNAAELVGFQLVLSLWAVALTSSDFYVTVTGLRGFLQHKPVMTFDLLAGLERRRLLLVVVALAVTPALLYADVARIYRGTTNGNLIWSLSTVLVGMFFTFCTLLVMTVLQRIPSPAPYVLTFSPTLFAYGTIIGIVDVWNLKYAAVAADFNNAPFVLGLNVSGVMRPSGAYTTTGIRTTVQFMAADTFLALGICLTLSIVYSTVRRKLARGSLLLSVGWTNTNGFLERVGRPHWITGLPLEQANAIKIGNKLFCKPSTQAILGFAIVAVKEVAEKYKVPDSNKSSTVRPDSQAPKHESLLVISMYQLVPTLCRVYRLLPSWATPMLVGTIEKNAFVAAKNKHIGHSHYAHSRGACVN